MSTKLITNKKRWFDGSLTLHPYIDQNRLEKNWIDGTDILNNILCKINILTMQMQLMSNVSDESESAWIRIWIIVVWSCRVLIWSPTVQWVQPRKQTISQLWWCCTGRDWRLVPRSWMDCPIPWLRRLKWVLLGSCLGDV